MAVEYRYEQLKTGWQGLDRMLLDRSRGIREYAAYILERHGGCDIRGYYLEHLEDDRPENAILGLAEYSRRGNVPALLKCLSRPERNILKCTLLALGSQEDFSDGELLWGYLLDERIELSKAAFLSMRKRGIHFGAGRLYGAYVEAEYAHQKRYLLKLLLGKAPGSACHFCFGCTGKTCPSRRAIRFSRASTSALCMQRFLNLSAGISFRRWRNAAGSFQPGWRMESDTI